jgi:hypothetical protein
MLSVSPPASVSSSLFALNSAARPCLQLVGGRFPVLIVDNLFAEPEALRSSALALSYRPPPYPYPGKIAEAPREDPSLQFFLRAVMRLVNGEYLPRVPPITANDQHITAFGQVHTDFAITDVHPDELSETQRKPHIDPVPIFGLVYLNAEERGGTLFFDSPASPATNPRRGYCAPNDAEFRLVGKIEGRFNRLAIYPGFVPHTGEIEGGWISSDERFKSPRLTQRLAFFP